MILSKQFLNEQVQKRNLEERFSYGGLFHSARQELDQYDVFICNQNQSGTRRQYGDL